MPKPITPDQFMKKAKLEVKTSTRRSLKAKVLRALAPVFGYDKKFVSRVWDTTSSPTGGGRPGYVDTRDILEGAYDDADIGPNLPRGLHIGDGPSITFSDILAEDYKSRSFWKHVMKCIDRHSEFVWVTTIRGSGEWVIHNTCVDPSKAAHSIIIPAKAVGGNNIQILRINNFIKEYTHDQEES